MNKDEILKSLSLKDKCKLFVGKNFWELESINGKNIFLSDGPHGIRKEVFINNKPHNVEAICYPAACLSACSFNLDLMKEYGNALALECIKNDIDVLLGPGINIKRNPLCGRNFEYFSEDPFLAGKLASNYIKGVQEKNIGVSLKHFALNSQEEARFLNNSIVDERAIHEIYTKAFKIAIEEAKPWTVMASYNLINGVHASENEYFLNTLLRDEFHFDGIVVSDWGAMCDPIKSIKAGLDLEMPGVSKGAEFKIYDAIKNNLLDEEILNKSTLRKIDLYLKTSKEKHNDFNLEKCLAVAKEINDESIVLLKNECKILPISKKSSIALIGDFAKNPRIQGGGSSSINAINVTNLYDEFKKENLNFEYARGYIEENLKPNNKLISEATKISKNKDVVILMLGIPKIVESEGYDRENMQLPESQLKLIEEIKKVNDNIVIILQNGSPIEMPFINDVKGIIEAYLGGSMHAKSIKDIILGNVNPSGRLAETFPLKYDDVVSKNYYLKDPYYSLYKESIYVGYRYYDTFKKEVLFPFGYGLSYSDISYSNLTVIDENEQFKITFKVKNNSSIFAKETVQIYVGEINPTIFKARKELKAFDKVSLKPFEEKDVTLYIKKDELKHYSLTQKKYILEGGNYNFYLAKNVSDESNYVTLKVESDDLQDSKLDLDIYYQMDREVSDVEFKKLINKDFSFEHKIKPFTLESPVKDISKTFLGFIIFGILKPIVLLGIKDPVLRKCYSKSIPYQPIRSLQMIGSLTKTNIEGLVEIFNGHLIKGFKKFKSKENIL